MKRRKTNMGFYANIEANVEYTDNISTTYFECGDEVICYTDKGRYEGRMIQVGTYQKDQNSEIFPAIYIDTSRSETSICGEIILMKDIKHMHRRVFEETEQRAKKDIVEMLQKMGYDEEFSEEIFDRLSKAIYKYNHTISKIIVCIDYAVKNHCSIENVLKQMCNIDETGIENELIKVKQECMNTMTETCRGFLGIFRDLLENRERDNLSANKV